MIVGLDEQTIIAQCTPQGSGALALLRISGSFSYDIVAQISALPSGISITQLPSHTIHFGWIIDEQGNHIDQVMFSLMKAPKSFTGDDTIEITCHNNPFIIQHIMERALSKGARIAQEGEFSKRAVLNKKIDLIQAEAINELIHANTQQALKQSLAQLEGSFSQWVHGIERSIIKAIAYSEASFEFIDEEQSFGAYIATIIQETLGIISTIKKTFDQQTRIRQGIRIALIGSVNAGKSSLFNALLNKDRAIVTSIAGTTRDVIEAGVYKNDCYWTLIDTAGLRNTDDFIEQEGIIRSFKEARMADIILLVIDGSKELTEQEQLVYQELLVQYKQKIISIFNKADLPMLDCSLAQHCANPLIISTKDKQNIELVEQNIKETIQRLINTFESPFLLNNRQFNLLLTLERTLLETFELLKSSSVPYELLSYHLNDALSNMSELTGKTISEKSMDAIFKEFCVGK